MLTIGALEDHRIDIKKAKKEYKKCLDQLYEHFYLKDNNSPSLVHELRVNLKRVDALVTLLRFNGIKLPQKTLKAFRSLFRVAGKLRTLQIEFDTINEYFTDDSLNPNYLHQLHEEKLKRLKAYSSFLNKGPSKRLRNSIAVLKKRVDHLPAKQILRYVHAEEKRLFKRLKRQVFREQQLHLIRKNLKRYYLNLKMAGQQNNFTETLLDLVGRWHDHQIAFDHVIRAIYTSNCTAAESEPIKKIKYRLIQDKENLYEKIVSFYVTNINHRDS